MRAGKRTMSDEKPKEIAAHLADIGVAKRRAPPKRGILDHLGDQEALPQAAEHRVMPNDSVAFLGGIYFVTRVDLEKDTVSFYVGDDLRTIPRSMVSKTQSCAVDPPAPIRRKR